MKLKLWLIQLGLGLPTLGIGLIWAIPYTTMIWTAGYVKIAGSRPLRDSDEFDDLFDRRDDADSPGESESKRARDV